MGMKYKCMNCGGGMYAEGGFVEEELASGFHDMPMKNPEHMVDHDLMNQSHDGDEMLMDEVMRSSAKGYSEGGKIANETKNDVESEDNDFDYLVKADDLESSYTGENSGDEIGNEQHEKEEDEDLDEVMSSRKKKDRNPRPA